jgi:ATP-binding cassette, subfamily C, bacterial CydD
MPNNDAVAKTRQDQRIRLHRLGAPGHADFHRAALAKAVTSALVVAQWATVVAVVAAAYRGDGRGGLWAGAALFVGVAVARVASDTSARRHADTGGAAVTAVVAGAVLDRDLGASVSDPAAPAHRVVELARQIGEHQAHFTPVRRAAPWCCAVILTATAVAHWPVAVLLAAATPIIPVNVRMVGLATHDAAARQLAATRVLSARLLDRFRGLPTLSTLGAIPAEQKSITKAGRDLNKATMAVLRRALVAGTVLDLVITLGIAITAIYCGFTLLGYVHIPGSGALTFGRALFVLMLAPAYFAPIRDLGSAYHAREQALAAVAALGELTAPKVCTRANVIRHAPRVTLAGICVRHGAAAVLDSVDAVVPPGTSVTVRGRSGAGKSTLLAVVAGLIQPASGLVQIDGRRPQPGAASWIGQQTVILPGTLADNLRLGNADASPTALLDAAERAGLGTLLARLPTGLDAPIGERGWGVSTGEAQRVAIARALLRDAGLWLLDEPTAHLDAESEAELVDTLAEAVRGRTVLIATHSPTVAAIADRQWEIVDADLLLTQAGQPVPS